MKPHYYQAKGKRLNYNFWFIEVRLPGKFNTVNQVAFDETGRLYYVEEQNALAKAGNPSAFDALSEFKRHNTDLWLKNGTSLKAGIRKINNFKAHLPTGSIIKLRNRYVGHDVEFHVNNPNPKTTNSDFVLRPGYSALTNSDRVFDNLVTTLREAAYLVEVESVKRGNFHDDEIMGPWKGDFYSATFTGNNITGAFCQESYHAQPSLSGRVAADHYDHFDKWSRTEVKMPIPTNIEQMGELLYALKAEGEYVSIFN